MLVFPQMEPTNSRGFLSERFDPRGYPGIQNGDETRSPGGRNSNMDHVGSTDFQKAPPSAASTLQSPHLGTKTPLTNQAENLISQQGMPQSSENNFCCYACFACCRSPHTWPMLELN